MEVIELLNPLENYPEVRKALYSLYWVVGVVLGIIPVAYAAVPDATVPTWSLVAMAGYGYLGIALGFTADRNTVPNSNKEE